MTERQQQSWGFRFGRAAGRVVRMSRHSEEPGSRRVFVEGIAVLGGAVRVGAPLAVGAAVDLMVSACNVLPPVSDCNTADGTDSCANLPELPVSPEYRAELERIIEPFKLLLPQKRQESLKISLHPDNNDPRNDGQGIALVSDDPYSTVIHLFLKDTKPAELNRAKETVFHEGSHIFDGCEGDNPSSYVGQRADTIRNTFVAANNLDAGDQVYALLTESTYTHNPREGHPTENYQELFASTLNVMNLDAFSGNLRRILRGERYEDNVYAEEVRQAVAKICLSAIEALQKYSSNPMHQTMQLEQFLEETQFPFAPELVQELRTV